MSLREFRRAGHAPTLLSAFLYFDISFMVWVILGPLAPFIGETYKLSAAQKGLLTAVPLLGGSFFRPILGSLTERIGGRRTGLIGLAVTLIPAGARLEIRAQLLRFSRAWIAAGRCRRQFCRSSTTGQRLVCARIPGPGHGHRRRR